jgi:hypothetical protein
MPRYCATIRTPADVESVFTSLARFDRAAEWDPGVAAGALLTEGPVGPGSRFRLVVRFLGRSLTLDYEVVEFEPRSRLALRAETGLIRSTDTITFGADDRGTIVRYEAVLDAKGWVRLAGPLLGLGFRRIGDRAAAGLRAHLNRLPIS